MIDFFPFGRIFFQVIIFKKLEYWKRQHDSGYETIIELTVSNFLFWLRNEIIFSPIATSSAVEVFIGGRYLLIIEHTIERYCSRCGIEEFCIVLARNLNCLIRPFTASTTHRTFVTHLDWLASDDVNCRRPFRNGGKTKFEPRPSMVSTESRNPLSTTTKSS